MKKIGEIFEFGGEWYQCVKSSDCPKCDLKHLHNCNHHFHCSTLTRKDGEEVIFKKLEKVGDPFERNGYMYQEYKAHIFPLLMNGDAKIPTRNGFAAIIKQNKEEDMKTVRISKDDLNFLVNKIRYGILPKHTDCDAIIAEITDLFSVEDVILSNSENIGKNLKPFDLVFKEVKEMEVKIQIPDNCELIKDGDNYVVREKKQNPPRSWEEFCERYPIQLGEIKLDSACNIYGFEKSTIRRPHNDRNVYTSKEEAEAFLALMQLRQLRKAWVGDWEPVEDSFYWGVYKHITMGIMVDAFELWIPILTFPTKGMAEDFLSCFKDLCEKAKTLL